MKIFVDFDGVVLNTECLLFNEDYYKAKLEPDFDKMEYMKKINWYNMLNNAEVINNSLEILKELKHKISILTKVNSLDNEGIAKVKYLREHDINCDIVMVPFDLKKTDLVNAKDNLLIDDTVHNLDDWKLFGGIPIFFNKDNMDIDNWNNKNTKYKKIKSLEYLKTL